MYPRGPELPDDLRMVEERLRRGRTQPASPELDRLKHRALAQAAAHQRKPNVIRSRLIALATSVVLLGGAGGAIALSGLDPHPNGQGGAANHQYHHHKYCNHGNPHPGKKCKGVGSGKGHHGYGHKHHHHHHGHHSQLTTGTGHREYGSRNGGHHHHHHHHHHHEHEDAVDQLRSFTG